MEEKYVNFYMRFHKAFQNKNHLGEKLDMLVSKFTFSLSRGSSHEGQTGEEGDGEEEFRFVRSDGQEEIGCTIKINPLASGATRSEFAKRKKPVKDIQRQQVVMSSGVGSGRVGGSSDDIINTVTTAAAEIEMTSMEKTEEEVVEEVEEEVEIFVDEDGDSYFVNSKGNINSAAHGLCPFM